MEDCKEITSDALINVPSSISITGAAEALSGWWGGCGEQAETLNRFQRTIACNRHISFGETHASSPWRSRQHPGITAGLKISCWNTGVQPWGKKKVTNACLSSHIKSPWWRGRKKYMIFVIEPQWDKSHSSPTGHTHWVSGCPAAAPTVNINAMGWEDL